MPQGSARASRIARSKCSTALGAAVLLATCFTSCLISCAKSPKPAASGAAPPAQLHLVSAQVQAAPTASGRGAHIVLPNASLVGCKAPNCDRVLPDASSDASAVYPWQVRLDFNQSAVIGLIALYDQPISIDDVQAAVDQVYGKWAMADFRTGPARLWRVEPPKQFAISLSVNDDGMVQLIYLSYDAKHPTSDRGSARALRECKENDNSSGFGCALLKRALSPR